MSAGYVPIPVWRVEVGDVVPGIVTCQDASSSWRDPARRSSVSPHSRQPVCLGR
jgi:hypothetical protein